MDHHATTQPDYGTGTKTLGTYLAGVIACAVLTIVAFWAVMAGSLTKMQTITLIFTAACIQFLVQVICFLRLSTQTEQGKTNVMAFIFTGVILLCIVAGSLWIMWNLNYYALH